MSARRTEAADNLLLITATAIFVLTAQRYLQTITAPEPAHEPVIAARNSFDPELSQHGHGRRSGHPLQIPFAGWKDILWRTYQQINEDRLPATAAGVKAVIEALNVVYGEREKRGFFRLNLLSLGFTTGAIMALLLMVSAVVALPLALDHLGLAQESKIIVSLVRWPVMFAMLLAALGVLYRFGPSRRAARRPRRCDGGHAGTGGSGRIRRTLARRINIDAKLAAPGGAQDTTDGCGFRVFPGGSSLDLRALRAT